VGKRIFVVDSQTEVCRLARECLEGAGYAVHVVSPGEVVSEARIKRPSLILISLTSESAGLELCRRLHDDPLLAKTALVFLLHSGIEEQCIVALECGADDCIEQPFSPRELVARIRAVLRRSPQSSLAEHHDTADLVIDSWAMKLCVRGTEVSTTTLEFRLIEYLARHRGQVFTRDVLLDAVWGDMQFITPRSVDACIRRIRQKIEPDRKKPALLKTIRGVGYRLDAATVWRSTADEACDCPACRTKPGAAGLSAANAGRRRPTA
jgi:two-component system, OmpR family, alkaline phosphatase synthesis response regulator PhoP